MNINKPWVFATLSAIALSGCSTSGHDNEACPGHPSASLVNDGVTQTQVIPVPQPIKANQFNAKSLESPLNMGEMTFMDHHTYRTLLMSRSVGEETLYSVRKVSLVYDRTNERDVAFLASAKERPSLASSQEMITVASESSSKNSVDYLQFEQSDAKYYGQQTWNTLTCAGDYQDFYFDTAVTLHHTPYALAFAAKGQKRGCRDWFGSGQPVSRCQSKM